MTEENDVGTLAEEALKLLRAVSADGQGDDHSCSNAWCPACQLVNRLRDHPEALDNVTRSAIAFARSVGELVTQLAASAEPPQSGDGS